MKRLLIHGQAEVELRQAVDYYEFRSPHLGLDFESEMEDCFARIRKNPKLFSFHKKTRLQRCIARRFPYIIFFREFDDRISIIAVANAKRRPDYWRNRMP